jgi:general secretion pathway protein G
VGQRSTTGFTIIELLVVVVIIGIIAAVAIPSLLNAIDRGRQKRTMSDLRTIGEAIQSYVVDSDHYPQASSIADLATVLESGAYISKLPREDAWGHLLLYSGSLTGYTVGSAAKDGGSTLTLNGSGGETNSFDDDVIYSNGTFVQWPDGVQQ